VRSRRRCARLGLAVALAAWLGPSRPAAAREPSACDAAATIGELTANERRALTQACEGAAAPEPDLQSAVFRVVSQSSPRSAALARLLAPMRGQRSALLRRGEVALQHDLARAQASLVARPEAIAGPNCADLRRTVEAFVADAQAGEAAAAPFIHDDPALLRCLGVDGAALAHTRLVTLRADNVEELLVAAATPDFAHLAWLQPRDALVFGRHRFFVAAVPPGAAVAAVAKLTNTEVPATWREIVSEDEVAWPEAPSLTCVNLDVRLGPGGAVYVDGAAAPRDELGVSRVLAVTRQEHEVVALECPDKDGPCHVRYREVLPAAALQRRTNQCLGVRLDVAARPRPTIAVLDATQGEACRAAPLRADGLRQGATDYLLFGSAGHSHDVRDLAAFAAATDALSALRSRLNPAAGAATGASPGADGTDLLGSAAKEAWRQGIDVLLSFDLQCVPRGDAWTYRLTATRVALGSMFRRGLYSGDSLDLGSFIEPVTEEFHASERLPVALASVIDRSLESPYVRLLAERPAGPYRAGASLTVMRYPGRARGGECAEGADAACRRPDDRAVVVRARRLTLGRGRPEVCEHLERTAERGPELMAAAKSAFQAAHGAPITLAQRRDPAGADLLARTGRAQLRGSLPGWYLVLAQWGDDEAPQDAVCVELTAPTREVWADVTMSFSGLQVAPFLGPEQLYARARLGYMQYLRPFLGLGIVVGYGHTRYAMAESRPTWQDLGVDEYGAVEWQRHALLVGGAVELRAPFARLPFDLRLRAAPTISLGALRVDRIPPSLTALLGNNGGRDLDVDLDLHFDAIVGYQLGKVALQHVLLLGLHAINDPMRKPPSSVYSNGGFFFGLGFGVGGAP
jgi:hypothetical protein